MPVVSSGIPAPLIRAASMSWYDLLPTIRKSDPFEAIDDICWGAGNMMSALSRMVPSGLTRRPTGVFCPTQITR
jgi:hypothetical protein